MGARGAAARIVTVGVLSYGASSVIEMNEESAALVGMALAAMLEPELQQTAIDVAAKAARATGAFAAEVSRAAIDIAADGAERPRVSRGTTSLAGGPSTRDFAYAFQGAHGLARGRFA